MEIRQLEHFIAVASEMSFSRAADRVHLVQSALSMSVGKLEKELGVALFDRSRQQIRLTPAGEIFREHARHVIQTTRLAKDALSEFRGELSGVVEFGALVSFGGVDVPRALGQFHRTYPLVQVRVRQAQTGSMAYLDAIADGSVDLALISAPNRFPAKVEMRLLTEDPMVFVCAADHPLSDRSRVRLAELADEDLIGFPVEYGLRRLIEDAFAQAGLAARTLYELSADYGLAAALIRNGLGSTFMPSTDAASFPDLRAIALQPSVIWQVYLASPSNQVRPVAARLAELLLQTASLARPAT